ncbi:MAG: leucine-rich repeat protein [Spirochaetaceae bacterium]|jgi:hypothetical protein|nr:leucine-rich repeat protein [Spirochaetaceae bacterium]
MNRKKIGLFFVLIGLCAAAVSAQTASDFEVTLTEDGNGVVIKGYTGKVSNTIKIPATIEGLPVREIGAGVFSYAGIGVTRFADAHAVNVTAVGSPFTVVLPSGLIKIGDRAFYESALTGVVIPDSVTSIGDEAFYFCYYYTQTGYHADADPRGMTFSLTSVTLPKGLTTVGKSAFAGNFALKTVVIPNGWTVISEKMFSGCSALTAITIPDNVTSIREGAFMSTGLTSITFGKRLTSIGAGAFSECEDIKTIVIPEWVTEIGVGAFGGCSALTTVTIPDSVESIRLGGTNSSSGRTLMEGAFNGCGKLNLATQARLKKITIAPTAYEVEQAEKQREAEERRAQEKREREEQAAAAQKAHEEWEAAQQKAREEAFAARDAEAKREQEQMQREFELDVRLSGVYGAEGGKGTLKKDQFDEFMSICEDYKKLGSDISSDGIIQMIIQTRLSNSQKKQFSTKFK